MIKFDICSGFRELAGVQELVLENKLMEERKMSLEAHIAELTKKHRELDRRIEDEEARPGSDDLSIHELKKLKLKLKDEIEQLKAQAAAE